MVNKAYQEHYCRSNLTLGHIAAAHRQFSRIRQVDNHKHLTNTLRVKKGCHPNHGYNFVNS